VVASIALKRNENFGVQPNFFLGMLPWRVDQPLILWLTTPLVRLVRITWECLAEIATSCTCQ
jgi:hypothetical protein